MHSPFMAMSAVKALQLSHACLGLAVNTSHPHCFHVCCVNKGSGMRDGGDGRNTARKERDTRREKCSRFGKSATSHCLPCGHNQWHGLCLWRRQLVKKAAPLISDAASLSKLDPPCPPFNRSLIIASRLCRKSSL